MGHKPNKMNTTKAIDLVLKERADQLSKGYTPENDLNKYEKYGLKEFAVALVSYKEKFPKQIMDEGYKKKLLSKPYRERLAIAAACLIAEMERCDLEDARQIDGESLEVLEQKQAAIQQRINQLKAGNEAQV